MLATLRRRHAVKAPPHVVAHNIIEDGSGTAVMLNDSGGIAVAQPKATGFYPYQDTDSPTDTTATRLGRLGMRHRHMLGIYRRVSAMHLRRNATSAASC